MPFRLVLSPPALHPPRRGSRSSFSLALCARYICIVGIYTREPRKRNGRHNIEYAYAECARCAGRQRERERDMPGAHTRTCVFQRWRTLSQFGACPSASVRTRITRDSRASRRDDLPKINGRRETSRGLIIPYRVAGGILNTWSSEVRLCAQATSVTACVCRSPLNLRRSSGAGQPALSPSQDKLPSHGPMQC
jgi:hypothetical protein